MKVLSSLLNLLAGNSLINVAKNDQTGSLDDELQDLNNSDEGEDGDDEDDGGREDYDYGDDGGDGGLGPTEKGEFLKNGTDKMKPTAAVGNFTLKPLVSATIPPSPSTNSTTKKRWYVSSVDITPLLLFYVKKMLLSSTTHTLQIRTKFSQAFYRTELLSIVRPSSSLVSIELSSSGDPPATLNSLMETLYFHCRRPTCDPPQTSKRS